MLIGLMAVALLTEGDPDGVVSTAPRGLQSVPPATAETAARTVSEASPTVTLQSAPHGMSTEQQIARWLGERPGGEAEPWAEAWAEPEPRRMHGQVSLGIGTGGYRDYAAAVSMPIGDTGELTLSVSQTENAPWYPYGRGYGYGTDWAFPYRAAPGVVRTEEPFAGPYSVGRSRTLGAGFRLGADAPRAEKSSPN